MHKRSLRIHYLQHVPFEGPGIIEPWAMVRGHRLSSTRLYAGHSLPAVDQLDWLFILGGPMNVYEEKLYPWLAREKRFIGEALHEGKVVIGVCLGAQLAASVLGAKVTRNPCVEIGWYPVEKTAQASRSPLSGFLPDRFSAFHWHGDTFDIPRGAIHLARSQACENQAFVYEDHVVGFQFHLESTRESVEQLIHNCFQDTAEGPFVQSPEKMIADPERYRRVNGVMNEFLDSLAASQSPL
ncbi:MAG TPA: type 1 glutamine amidotransferase [Syntrophales bacterium]|nr:type 1 glutamine amidotransferase [Syntrophales bacterium]